jgi:hypothetical protein
MFTLPTRPQSIGEVLDSSIKLFRQSFPQSWPIALTAAAVRSAVLIYMTLHLGLAGKSGQVMKLYSTPSFLTLSLASALISLVLYGALLFKTNAVATDTDMSTGEALNSGLRAGPRIFLASLGFGLACALGFVLLIIPGLYISIALALYAAAIVVDDQRAGESLGTSRRLVKGNYWRTAAIFTVAFVILMIVFMALGVVVGISAVALSHDPTVILLINTCVQSLVYIVTYPFFASILVVVYHDLKLRNEGGDLAARVQTLA